MQGYLRHSQVWLRLLFVLLLSTPAALGAAFAGVGIDGVPQHTGEIEVRQLVTNGPAHQAGIRVGDVITHIDGIPIRGLDFQHVVSERLRGRSGSQVILTVRRTSSATPLTFTMVRRLIVTR
jgi:C-terminal processing protease CtpA/Prc